jgi:hypothetical protein
VIREIVLAAATPHSLTREPCGGDGGGDGDNSDGDGTDLEGEAESPLSLLRLTATPPVLAWLAATICRSSVISDRIRDTPTVDVQGDPLVYRLKRSSRRNQCEAGSVNTPVAVVVTLDSERCMRSRRSRIVSVTC